MKIILFDKNYVNSNPVLWLVYFFLLGTFSIFSQTRVDSLEQLLETQLSEEDELKVQVLLSESYLDNDLKKANEMFAILKNKLETTSNVEALIRFHIAKGIYFRMKREINSAENEALKALDYVNNSRDSILYKSKIYNLLGSIADDNSNIQEAMKFHLIALRYAESINHEPQIATICNGIGRAYEFLSEYENAKKYLFKAIAIKEKNNELDEHLGRMYTNLSNCFDAEGNYQKALIYIEKSLFLKKKFNSIIDLSMGYNNKAFTLFLMKSYTQAEKSVITSIKYADSLKNETDLMYAYSTYAEILFAQNRVQKAEELMSKSVTLSKKNNDLYLAKYNLDLLYNIQIKKENYKKALGYFKQRSDVLDSIHNIKSQKVVQKLVLEYETEKKNTTIDLLNTENIIKEIKLKRSRQLQIAFLITALLSIAVLTLLWSRHKNKIKTDKLIKEAMKSSFDKKLAASELQVLRSQMNPHFLFNCLNSINSFIIKNEQENASEYLSKFSKLIRKVLSNSKETKVTLANELEALELYLELEALRFNNKFEYIINLPENVEVDYLEIPPLIIQPYVENSIWHGLLHKKEGVGKISISIVQEQNLIICTIEDNGIGRDASAELKSKSAEKRKSFGMSITKERLKYINHKNKETTHVLVEDLKSEKGNPLGTRVIIKIEIGL